MANEKKRYVVAPGASFVGNKRAYNSGDEIDESAFGKPQYFKKMLSSKPPKIIEAPPETEKTTKKDGNNTADPGADKRKAMEEKAVLSGLARPEELEQFNDEQLEKLLKDYGVTE
jgi:hypothetical protein